MEDIEKDTSQLLYRAFYAERESKSNKSTFKCGDVLYGKLRPYLNKVIIADLDGVCTTEIVPIVPGDGLHPAYLKYLLKSPAFQRYVNSLMYGIKMPRLGTEDAIKSVHPLPPLAEQHRIVAKVDELMALCDQLELRSESQLAAHQTLVETLLATLTDSCDADELAQNWARLSAHFDTLFTTEASIDALKQTILQLAVMGKLVPQDPSDEPASALLERIAAEKAQLVKEKKIKKEKPLPAISEDEKPFELPQGWAWARGEDIADFVDPQPSHRTPPEVEDGVPYIGYTDIDHERGINFDNARKVSEVILQEHKERYQIKDGDFVFGKIGTLGKPFFLQAPFNYCLSANLILIQPRIGCTHPVYLATYLNSPTLYQTLDTQKTNSTHAVFGIKKARLLVVPFPPISEQHRIVTKVDELMTLCDQLKSRLQTSQQTQLALAESLVEGALA